MDEMENKTPRPVNPRRRRRTKAEIFKESYLPVLIAGVAVLFILITIIGAIVQGVKRSDMEEQLALEQAAAEKEQQEKLSAEASKLLSQANTYASQYYYELAINTLDTFSGDISQFPQLVDAKNRYTDLQNNLIAWDDPAQITNLSFQLLIADPVRAFADSNYGTAYNRNFVTIDEFRIILDQLYENGYVLVGLEDIVETVATDSGTSFATKTVYLPEGKKPIVITQTHVNYNIFMTDGNGDKLPDKDGAGFASKLIVDERGKLVNEYIDRDGNVLTGEYDLVPILNSFIQKNPSFSYRGAKAIIAVTGYDGLFGYRTNPGAKNWLSEDAYAQEVTGAKKIAEALRKDGYEIACYTYENTGYGYSSLTQVQADLKRWNDEVVPLLGTIDILAFAQISDIADQGTYTGDKFQALTDSGFRYFLGFTNDGSPWANVESSYFRHGRILVTGSNMKYKDQWFDGLFDPVQVLSSTRGTIPN